MIYIKQPTLLWKIRATFVPVRYVWRNRFEACASLAWWRTETPSFKHTRFEKASTQMHQKLTPTLTRQVNPLY